MGMEIIEIKFDSFIFQIPVHCQGLNDLKRMSEVPNIPSFAREKWTIGVCVRTESRHKCRDRTPWLI